MLILGVISFILASLSLIGVPLTEAAVRLFFLTSFILFVILGCGLLLGRRAIEKLRKNIYLDFQAEEETEEEPEVTSLPFVPEKPGVFFREQNMVFGPDGRGAFSVSFWLQQQPIDGQEYLGMQELDYLFLELEGDYKLTKRKQNVGGKIYIIYTFQSGYQVDFNKSRYINFGRRRDGSYLLEIKLGRLNEKISEKAMNTLVIRVTLPAKIDMANSMTYEDRTVEWQLTDRHLRKNLTLKAFTLPFTLLKIEK